MAWGVRRLCPRMHALFAQIHGTTRLQADSARCSITPPSRDPTETQGLHWGKCRSPWSLHPKR